jgi:hypothetical protein
MKKVLLGAIILVVAVGLGIALFRDSAVTQTSPPSAGSPGATGPAETEGTVQPRQKESASLAVGKHPGTGRCVLWEDRPSTLRTTFDHQITWIVVNQEEEGVACSETDQIAIGQFTKDGKPFDILMPGNHSAPTKHLQTIRAKLRQKGDPAVVDGLYRYQILINGEPAGYFNPRDKTMQIVGEYGLAEVCPDWPC